MSEEISLWFVCFAPGEGFEVSKEYLTKTLLSILGACFNICTTAFLNLQRDYMVSSLSRLSSKSVIYFLDKNLDGDINFF